MIDFTKEELKLLSESLHYAKDSPCWHGYTGVEALEVKIQSLIDNYCEHEESEVDHNYEVERCKKCKTLFLG